LHQVSRINEFLVKLKCQRKIIKDRLRQLLAEIHLYASDVTKHARRVPLSFLIICVTARRDERSGSTAAPAHSAATAASTTSCLRRDIKLRTDISAKDLGIINIPGEAEHRL
jgi:hypothetical protein